jgi:hypothetical protein
MQTLNTLFEQELKKKIEAAIEDMEMQVSTGHGIDTFEQYKQTVGRIGGLRWALEMCDEVNSSIAKR